VSADNIKWRVNRGVRASNLPPAARLIMFVLSDMADAKTGMVPLKQTPSLADLARETGHGESTVKEQLAVLEELGWVKRSRPNASERARHVPTYYQVAVGSPGKERAPLKRKPRARSKPSDETPEGQELAIGEGREIALENESEGQELANRGPGANDSRARSWPSYLKDDDLYDHDDQKLAADAAPIDDAEVVFEGELIPPPKTAPKRSRKASKPKPPDPFGDIAQELTEAFFERHKGRTAQKFPAVRGVVKTALEGGVPRNVVAHAMNAVMDSGWAISEKTLTNELSRMWQAANSSQGQGARTTGQQRLDEAARIAAEMRELDEQEAAAQQPRTAFALPPGRTA